jgi:hypothetical protein
MGTVRKKSWNEEVLKDKALMAAVCEAVALREREAADKAMEAVKQLDLPPLGQEEAERQADAAIRAAAQFEDRGPPAAKSGRVLPQSSQIDHQVEMAVEAYFKQLRGEARDWACERLYRLNALGVEWHHAARGWIYLADERRGVLRSLERAAFNTDRLRQELPISDNGILSRVYRRGAGELVTPSEGKFSGSVLAVPIFAPTRGKILGVYLLEADHPGAFTPAQVRELQRQVIFFTPHLIVLEGLDKADDFSTWPYHPELHRHGWSVEPLVTGFCRTVAESLRVPNTRPPACTLWIADWMKNRCWVLAAHGYDYFFLDRDTLGPNSAVARVARNHRRAIEGGTPDQLKFVCPEKARDMGVRQVVIASLHDYSEEPFSGTLNISFFDERRRPTLPSHGLVEWLAERAERLVASLHAQRVRLAMAYLHCELAKGVSSGHGFGALLRTVLRCLDAPVGSVFARKQNTRTLQCVETTGLENKGAFEEVTYDLDDLKSLTCWAARNPDKVARHNWGPVEEGVTRPKDQPIPSNQSRERMVPEVSRHRRSLIKGVALLRDDPHPHTLGAIRVMRPGRSRPFTIADERLLSAFAEASTKLFTNWTFACNDKVVAQSFNTPLTRIEEVLQGCVSGCADNKYPIMQASVFVRDERRLPQYRLYAYYRPESQDIREDLVPEPVGDQVLAPTPLQGGKIIVVKSILLGDNQGMRICVPSQVWSGRELVEALLALDFERTGLTWPSNRKAKVFKDARKLSAIWASNPYWYPDPEILEGKPRDIVREYLDFLSAGDSAKGSMIPWARLRLLDRGQYREIDSAGTVPAQLPEAVPCPEPELQRFGVRLGADASYCVFPLLLGPFWGGEMICGLDRDLANALAEYLPPAAGQASRHPVDEAGDRESGAFQKLRDMTVRVTGPWCRVIAGNLLLWDVGFGDDCEEQDKIIWNEEIRLKPDLLAPPGIATAERSTVSP